MNHYVITNPHARNGRAQRKLRELLAEMERRGLPHEVATCNSLEHARALSCEANLSGADVIVAVGGDGTINRVLNGFFDEQGRRVSRARLGVLHVGTSPDFCRSYGIPTEARAAVETLAAGFSRSIKVGRVIYGEGSAGEALTLRPSAVFGCCANIGLGASLARLANGGIRRYFGDGLGTLLALLRVLRSYRPRTLHLNLDGQPRVLEQVYNISVGKTFHVASGLKICHVLTAQDDRLYLMCLRNLSWSRLGWVLRTLYGGRPIISNPCLSLEYGRRIALSSPEAESEVEFDGDPAGSCPCRIASAPDPLDLIVEASA
jgi:diacylglycerol kinase family enzyme